MYMRNYFFVLIMVCAVATQAQNRILYKDSKQPIQKRIDDLLSRMTLEEKVYQLCALYLSEGDEIYKSTKAYSIDRAREGLLKGFGSVSIPTREMYAGQAATTNNILQKIALEETRLGIPLLLNEEALHGMVGRGACSFPQPIGLASTWDLELMEKIGNAIGKEIKSRGVNQVLSPTLDLGRDPRHGRFGETYGEDPLLVSLMGGLFINEIQKYGIACTPKHFVANFVGEGGREAANIELSERALRESHLVPYEYAVRNCGVLGMMAAYNALNSVPCSANSWLLNDLLRKEWGFKGVVVSDWSGVPHLYNNHHCVENRQEGAIKAIKAGLDIDLPREYNYKMLIEAVKEGQLSEDVLEINVRRVLWLKFHLGLFENPFVKVKEAEALQDHPAHRDLALEAARKSMVLLKNDGVLPIQKSIRKIAVLGPNANSVRLGGYSATGVKAITPLEGLKRVLGNEVELIYEEGTGLFSGSSAKLAPAINAAKDADLSILFMGGGPGSGGESVDRMELALMGEQESFIQKIAELGKPVIVVLVDERPIIVRKWINKVNGLIMMWYAGEEGGNAIAEVLKGVCNPSGKLPCTFPLFTGQCPLYYSYYPQGRESRTAEIQGLKANNLRYEPQFPFGYGLSYTTFEYSDLVVKDENTLTPCVSVEIKNTGKVGGDEIVQLYLSSKANRIVRRVKELKQFKRIHLEPGESKRVAFTLKASDFEFLNEKLEREIDKGEYEVMVGQNSENGIKAKLIVL